MSERNVVPACGCLRDDDALARVAVDGSGVHLRGRPVGACCRRSATLPCAYGRAVHLVVGCECRVPDDLPRGERAVLGRGVYLLGALLAGIGIAHRRQARRGPENVRRSRTRRAASGSDRWPSTSPHRSRRTCRRSSRRETRHRCPVRAARGRSRNTRRDTIRRRRRGRACDRGRRRAARASARRREAGRDRPTRTDLHRAGRRAAQEIACWLRRKTARPRERRLPAQTADNFRKLGVAWLDRSCSWNAYFLNPIHLTSWKGPSLQAFDWTQLCIGNR